MRYRQFMKKQMKIVNLTQLGHLTNLTADKRFFWI